MPSVKIPRKSTATDMTPFVDVAFLILSFFMLATKFKPPAPVEITTPHSVSTTELKEQDAVLIEFDSSGRVFFTVNVQKPDEQEEIKKSVIDNVDRGRKLGLTEAEKNNFIKNATIGVPFSQLKALLNTPVEQKAAFKQAGIPVDSTDNQLVDWIANANYAFSAHKLTYMIKGDNNAKYPQFKGVIDALRKNEQFKYQLVTDPESAPIGSELYKKQEWATKKD